MIFADLSNFKKEIITSNLKENNKYLSKVIFTIELCNGVNLSENCGKDSDFYKICRRNFPSF